MFRNLVDIFARPFYFSLFCSKPLKTFSLCSGAREDLFSQQKRKHYGKHNPCKANV